MRQAEIDRFKTKLEEMRARLRSEIPKRREAIVDSVNPPGEIYSYGPHLADDDAGGLTREISAGEAQTAILEQVESALERISGGEYGKCERCGRGIAKERLETLPYTTRCIDCEREIEAERVPQE